MTTGDVFWYELTLYSAVALVSTCIILYFRIKGRSTSFREYMLGDGRLGLIPITLSMIASTVSHNTIMSIFEEVYVYGSQYLMSMIDKPIVCLMSCTIFIPLFYELNFLSPHEYCELRFDKRIRTLLSINFIIGECLVSASALYTLSRFIQQVVGIDIWIIQVVTAVICTLYTFLGGFNGVVWTDALQAVVILLSITFLIVIAMINAGGWYNIYRPYYESGRFDVIFDWDPTIRLSFWSVLFGKFTSHMNHTPFRPFYCQRLASLNNIRLAKWASIIEITTHSSVRLLAASLAIVAFARYEHCDPVKAGLVKNYLQMPLYYAMDVGRKLKVTQAVIILGVICAGVSSLSTNINTIPFIAYNDVYSRLKNGSPGRSDSPASAVTVKIMVVVFGVIIGLLSFLLKSAGPIRELFAIVTSIKSINYTIFLVGIFFPVIDAKGILWGALTSLVLLLWMSIGSRIARAQGILDYPTKILRTDGCGLNATVTDKPIRSSEDLFYLYRITPHFYSLISFIVLLSTSLIVSVFLVDKNRKPKISSEKMKKLVWSKVRRFVPEYDPVVSDIPMMDQKEPGMGECSKIEELSTKHLTPKNCT